MPTKHYLLLDGSPGTYAWTDDKSSLDLVTGIDVRIAVTPDDPTPGSYYNFLVRKDDGNGATYALSLDGFGQIVVSSEVAFFEAADFPSGDPMLIRVGPPEDDGFGGWNWTFYTKATARTLDELSSDDGWVPTLASPKSGGSPPFPDVADSPLYIGANNESGWPGWPPLAGRVYGMVLKDIDGVVVASPDFTAQRNGTTEFTDDQGNIWHLSGNAVITGRRGGLLTVRL